MVPVLWMVVGAEHETLRLPGDWVVSEPAPVEVPTREGVVDLRQAAQAALGGAFSTVLVHDGVGAGFTVTFTVEGAVPVSG